LPDTVDAHLSRGEQHPGCHHPSPGAHSEGHGGEDRHQARDKRLRRHWQHTRIVWRGDSHYGRVEAMEWAESSGEDYIFGLGGNAALDARVAETAANLRFHHAASSEAKLRTYTSFMYQANSWARPRKVVARLECSLQPDTGGEITSIGMRQEVDVRYVVTSLKGSAQHLYEDVYCQRGQMDSVRMPGEEDDQVN
jgi:hypothetical protein